MNRQPGTDRHIISVSIHPHQLSFNRMEENGVFDKLVELYRQISVNYVIAKEKSDNKINTHYQCYLYDVNMSTNGVLKKHQRMLSEFLLCNEVAIKKALPRNRGWICVKLWRPTKKQIESQLGSNYGLGYCLKEGGQISSDFALATQKEALKHYKEYANYIPPNFRKTHPHINHKLMSCRGDCYPNLNKQIGFMTLCHCDIQRCIRCEYEKSLQKKRFYYKLLVTQLQLEYYNDCDIPNPEYSSKLKKLKDWLNK